MLNFLIIVISSVITSSLWVWFHQYRLQRKLGTRSLLMGLQKEVDMMIAEINKTTERSITLIENQVQNSREEVRKLRESLSQLKKSSETNIKYNNSYSASSMLETANSAQSKKHRIGANSEEVIPAFSSGEEANLPDLSPPQLTPREKAVMLHRNGHSISSIASELKMSLGEVRLMISLNNRGNQ